MSKFVQEKTKLYDLEQCKNCSKQYVGTNARCDYYPDVKPVEILANKEKCKYFEK